MVLFVYFQHVQFLAIFFDYFRQKVLANTADGGGR